MHFEGSVPIKASREKVWAFVIDPEQVGPCGPGVETIEVVDATHFKATAKVGIGFISARFNVSMEFAEQEPPDRALIKAPNDADLLAGRARRPEAPSTRRPRCTSRTARTAQPSWTGPRT